jgi:putative transposase
MKKSSDILLPETFYHIYNRGNNKENLFLEEKNYLYFMQLLEKHLIGKIDLLSYSLLPNHFHFFIKTNRIEEHQTEKIFNQSFSNFFNAYAKAINKSYNRDGSLFKERFRRKVITSDAYFTNLIYYIHFNAQKHKLVKDFKNHKYNSYHNFLKNNYTFLNKKVILDWFSGIDRFEKYHNEYQLLKFDNSLILENIDDD